MQVVEEVGLSPIVSSSSANQNPPINVTLTLSSSNFCHPCVVSSTMPVCRTPGAPSTHFTTLQTSSAISALPLTNIPSIPTSASTLDPLLSVVGGVATPLTRSLLQNVNESASTATSHTPSLLPTCTDTTAHNEPQSPDPMTFDQTHAVSHDGNIHNEVQLGVVEDSYCHSPGEMDENEENDDDDVIVLPGSTPGGRNKEASSSSHPTHLDSSEDFQESPLPRTPKRRSSNKNAGSKSNKKKNTSSTLTRKKTPCSLATASPRGRPLFAKKEIVTRSKALSHAKGSKNLSENCRLPRQSGMCNVLTSGSKTSKPPQQERPETRHKGKLSTDVSKPTSISVLTPDPGSSRSCSRPLTRVTGNEKITCDNTDKIARIGTTPARHAKKNQVRERKRPLTDDDNDRAATASPRKKAKNSESCLNSSASEIALHTRGLC